MNRLEKAIGRVKELIGQEFKIDKCLTHCNIVKVVNQFGGQTTIARFNNIRELELFLDNLQLLKWHGVI